MKKKFFYNLFTVLFATTPVFAFAQSLANSTFRDLVEGFLEVLRVLVPVMVTAAFVVFFWGIAKIVGSSGNAAQIQAGRNYLIWSIVAIFCLLALNGIINFAMTSLGFSIVAGGAWGLLLPGNP